MSGPLYLHQMTRHMELDSKCISCRFVYFKGQLTRFPFDFLPLAEQDLSEWENIKSSLIADDLAQLWIENDLSQWGRNKVAAIV